MIEHIPQDIAETIRSEVAPQILSLPRRMKSMRVAEVLFFKYDIYPSVAVVRSFTQQGSSNDIARDLAEFWGTVRARGRDMIDLPDIPAQALADFTAALGVGWKHLANAAQNLFVAERATLRNEAEAAAAALADTQRAAMVALADTETLREQLSAQRAETARLVRELAAVRETAAVAKAVAQEQCEASSKTLHQLEATIAAEREQRQRIEEMSEREVNFAKVQIDRARAETARVRGTLDKTRKDLENAQTEQSALAERTALLRSENTRLQRLVREQSPNGRSGKRAIRLRR